MKRPVYENTETERINKRAEEFYLLACEYCSYVERNAVTRFNANEFTKHLLKLYLAGINLPEIEELPMDELDEHRPSLKNRKKIKVKEEDYFWSVFNPFKESSLCQSSISDALEDIYADLSAGMECYEKGAIADAVYYWKLYLNCHWGNHLVEVLKPLYYIQSNMN